MKGTHEQYGIRNGHGPGASQPQGKDAMSRATVTIHTVSSDDGVSQQQTQSIPLPARLLIKVQVGSRVQRRHIEVDEDGNIQETRVEASGVGS